MKVKSESEVAQWCLTLRDPMDCSLPGSSVHGIFQARILEGGASSLAWEIPWMEEPGKAFALYVDMLIYWVHTYHYIFLD